VKALLAGSGNCQANVMPLAYKASTEANKIHMQRYHQNDCDCSKTLNICPER